MQKSVGLVYTKPTDTHQYLLSTYTPVSPPTSCHLKHCCKNVPYSLALRLRCICSDSDTFESRARELTGHLCKRGYQKQEISLAIERALQQKREDLLSYRPKFELNVVYLITCIKCGKQYVGETGDHSFRHRFLSSYESQSLQILYTPTDGRIYRISCKRKSWCWNLFCLFFYFSISHSNIMHKGICFKDFAWTTAPRILKFGTHFGYDCLYCVRDNQHPHAYHSLYLSFVSFFISIKHFVTDFLGPMRARVFKFWIHLQRIKIYQVKEAQDTMIYFAVSLFLFPSVTQM